MPFYIYSIEISLSSKIILTCIILYHYLNTKQTKSYINIKMYTMKKKIQSLFIIIIIFAVIGIAINFHIDYFTNEDIYNSTTDIPSAYTALILGAGVYKSGRPSAILKDRLLTAIDLYKKKKVKRLLVSGDHGKKYYDEVNNMKKFLLEKGIPKKDMFLDHAGFNTYNSIVRAKGIFQVKDLIIVTQEFHLPRAVYIAGKIGLKPMGLKADIQDYPKLNYFKMREYLAKIKSFFEVLLNINPRFKGPEIPITGDSGLSWDNLKRN